MRPARPDRKELRIHSNTRRSARLVDHGDTSEGSMTKRFRSVSAAFVIVLGAALATGGCGQYSFGALKAKKAIREAHEHYKANRFREAGERYEEALAADPERVEAYFYLGNSYDNLYKPNRAGEPENDAYMQKAIENYKRAAERGPDAQMRNLAMRYLVAAYGPDKLNRPEEAEPVVKRMIEVDPNEPENYFALAKIYEDAGRYEEAEQALLKAKEVKPNDQAVYLQLSGFYNRQGDFDKTMEPLHYAAELQPDNPQGYHLVATYYEEKVRKDHRLSPAQAKEYLAKGIAAEDKALSLNKDYIDAMVYKNILLRRQATFETDRAKQLELIRQADELRNKAMEMNKKKASGIP
jgi:tetratricopeptide (TPR) repeat protein